MMRKVDAIVVGGGLAGLTSGAYLSRYGFETLLCEKREKTGGLVETFRHQGFAFDAGIRAFENSGILFPMLRDLGIDIPFKKNQVVIGIGDQKVKLESKDSLEPYMAMLVSLFPDNEGEIHAIKEEILKVRGYMDVLYGIDNPLFMGKLNMDYLTGTLLPWFIRYQKNIGKVSQLQEPIQAYLYRFTKNKRLIDMITQHFFKETPTFFALSYFSLYLDYCYPLGGTGILAEKMTEYIRSAGGEIRTGAGIARVDAGKHQVELETGEVLLYKKMIWAADQRTLYQVTKGVSSSDFDKKRLLSLQSNGGDSVLTIFVGVDQPCDYFQDRCGAHMFYTADTRGLSSLPRWQEIAGLGEEELYRWLGDYLERTTFEISCPVIRDKNLAPEGKTGLIISTLMDYGLVKGIFEGGRYEGFKGFCTRKIIDLMTDSLFPEVGERILFALCATPLTIEKKTHNTEGAITGWAFTNPVMPSENRFRKIGKAVNTPIPDVYQCGQWTFSPSGLPVSIVTGKLAADQAAKKGFIR